MNHFNITKKICISILAIALFQLSLAQNPSFEWAKQMGGTGMDRGLSITKDNNGNIYTTGYFTGTADFNPGTGTTNLTSAGNKDIFIQKLDSTGTLLWAKKMGGTGYDSGNSIITDNSGNVYTTGWFQGTADFDPGVGTANLTSMGLHDIFIQKLDALGNFLWAKKMGGTGYDDGYSITIDNIGNVYITGYFEGTVDFNPGVGTTYLTSSGNNDIFIQKLDSTGNLLWAKKMGGNLYDLGYSIIIDNSGNIYVSGSFYGTADFDPGPGTSNLTSSGNDDIFIQKLNSSGNLIWVKKMGGTGMDRGLSITTDNNGNIYTTGFFKDSVDFDPGVGTTNLNSAGNEDIFIQKLDSSGNLLWVKQMGGIWQDNGNSISTDNSGNVYTIGNFNDTVDFDPGIDTTYLIPVGSVGIFIQKLDALGNLIWVKNIGGGNGDVGSCITIDYSGNVYTTGLFKGTVDFDPGLGTTNLTSVAISNDIFILKLGQCNTSPGTDVVSACDAFTWIDSITYTSSNNTVTHTLINAQGCDSVVTLNLTINYSNAITDVITACDSYTWIDSVTYTASNNIATHTLINSTGCDSVITLNLTINYSNTGTDTITACNSYTWIDGNTYTASNNTATYTLTNAQGCDSVVTLNLTINTVDVLVWPSDPTITANATAATYQWLDCNNNYSLILGATAQSYTATSNGDYAVEITQSSCVDTSACVTISTVGTSENLLFKEVFIYPNPTQDIVNINLGNLRDVSLKVFNIHNQLIYHKENINTPIYKFELKEAAGVYFFELSADGEKQQYKLIKGL